jgi:hypothetical protein
MKLRRFEIRWATVIGRALLPVGLFGGVVDSADLGDLFYRECLGHPWYSALVVRLSLWITWFSPLLWRRRLVTFGALDPQAREAMLETLLASPIYAVRATAFYFKLTACMVLLGDERVLERIGAYEHGRAPAPASERRTSERHFLVGDRSR